MHNQKEDGPDCTVNMQIPIRKALRYPERLQDI